MDGTSPADADSHDTKTPADAAESVDFDSLRAQLSEAQHEIVQTRRLVDTLRADCEREGAVRQDVEREAAQESERLNLEIERLMQEVAAMKVHNAVDENTLDGAAVHEADTEALREQVEAQRRMAEERGREGRGQSGAGRALRAHSCGCGGRRRAGGTEGARGIAPEGSRSARSASCQSPCSRSLVAGESEGASGWFGVDALSPPPEAGAREAGKEAGAGRQ